MGECIGEHFFNVFCMRIKREKEGNKQSWCQRNSFYNCYTDRGREYNLAEIVKN